MPEIELDGADALVLVDDSERNSDLLWATGFRAPDAFTYIATATQAWVVVKDLELDRARQQVRGAEVLSSTRYETEAGQGASTAAVLGVVLRDKGLERLRVPADFGVGLADRLRADGFEVAVASQPLFPARALKTPDEIEAIARAQVGAEAGMEAARQALAAAVVDGDGLRLDGEPVTSQGLRRRIQHALLDADCAADHIIVAGGEQAIDPHEIGHGPLPAHRPIIIDIFPRELATGYWGDITRTFVRGAPSDEAVRLYDTVLAAQAGALERLRAGVDGAEVHAAVAADFADAGYETGERDGRMQGFFHGTGHGVGLDIHEAPRLSRGSSPLEAGHAVTVEPGLYYAGLGGVRIEDLVIIETGGVRNLTTFPKDFIL